MAAKAQENLAAGRQLLDGGHVNAAASRLYYSAFQACVHAFETKHGMTPGKLKRDATTWEHGLVTSNAGLVRSNRRDRVLCEVLKNLRVEADYEPTSVNADSVRSRIDAVAALVHEATT